MQRLRLPTRIDLSSSGLCNASLVVSGDLSAIDVQADWVGSVCHVGRLRIDDVTQ